MKLSDESKKQIIEVFLETIESISDIEYQKRVWIRGEGPECDDFDETACFFLEDSDPILENYKDFNITDSQYSLLKKLADAFENFSDTIGEDYLPQDFLSFPEWEKIVEMAKEVLQAFNYQKKLE